MPRLALAALLAAAALGNLPAAAPDRSGMIVEQVTRAAGGLAAARAIPALVYRLHIKEASYEADATYFVDRTDSKRDLVGKNRLHKCEDFRIRDSPDPGEHVMRTFLKPFIAALAAIAATLSHPAIGATDGAFIMSTPANEAPDYESDYAASQRLSGLTRNTPESDARPGEYYFLEAVHALRKHDYAFAIQMYEVSASWAYKPAEYNLGVIYAQGQGVEVDLPRAMAWMALAAERNEPHYVEAREAVYASITPAQFEQANAIWRELKKTYGDQVALRRAKARWAEVKSHMTGSRVGMPGNLTVGMPNPNSGVTQGPKIIVPGGATGKSINNAHEEGSHAGPTTAGEVLGGSGVDGTVAYRQLRASDNPYDPKFDRSAAGTATVGPPTTIAKDASGAKPADDKDDKDDKDDHDRN